MHDAAFTRQEQTQLVESGELQLFGVGGGEVAHGSPAEQYERAEIEIVPESPLLIVDSGHRDLLVAVGIDHECAGGISHAHHPFQCSISQRDGGGLGAK